MYNIALINPPSPFLIDQRVFPNMGIVRVGTTLRNEGHHVDIYDFSGINSDKLDFHTKILIKNNYDYYGFSSTTPQFPYTYKLFKKLKLENPKAKTVIGGPHASAISSLRRRGIEDINIKTLDEFDTVFDGEGEDTTNMFKPGWQRAKIEMDIDKLPIPDRSLIDLKSYKYNLLGKPTTSIQTQRGCPYQCVFCCGRDIDMYRKVRTHSPERILKEMDELHDKYGYSSFMWYDDEININPDRLSKLCKLLAKRPYQHRGFVRSDLIVKYPETVNMLKYAGFVKLCAGVESGSNKMLENIGKGITSKENLEARKLIKDAGIHYESFLLLGHPGETLEDVEDTFLWLRDANPDDFDINLVTPYPGSKLYDEATPSKEFKDYAWEYNGLFFNKPDYSKEDSYYKGLDKQSASNIRTKEISNKQYIQLRNELEAKCRR